MKRLLFTLTFILLFLGTTFGQFTKIGGGLFYDHRYYFNEEAFPDHKLGNPAIFITGIYEISLPLHLSTRINMHMPNITKTGDASFSSKIVISGYSLDADAHYVFNSLDRFELYGLAGLNLLYIHRKEVFEFTGAPVETFKESNTALGLNLGIGSYMKVKEQFDLFFELKAIVASQIQVVGTAGILLNIDWLKKNEDPGY